MAARLIAYDKKGNPIRRCPRCGNRAQRDLNYCRPCERELGIDVYEGHTASKAARG